jgi:hypothetical protein
MIEVLNVVDSSGRRGSKQRREKPSVYLDHWAFRKISENRELAERFRRALLPRKGTLSISFVNIAEFSQVTDVKQLTAAEEFIDSLLPRIYFQNVNFPQVIEIEKADIQWMQSNGAQGKRSNGSPDSDINLMNMFTQSARDFGTSLTARRGMQEIATHRSKYKAMTQTFADLFINRARTEWFPGIASAKLSEINSMLRHLSWQSLTEPLFVALCEELVRRKSPIKPNDVNDYAHMIVPVTNNDYVLLDKPTRHTASQIMRRLEKVNTDVDPRLGKLLNCRFASVYSEPDLENFFSDLEAGADITKTDSVKTIAETIKSAPLEAFKVK